MNHTNIISLSEPIIGAAEKQALAQVIDSQWLTMGDRVIEFEKAFAGLHDMNDAVAVNSCTAGLHLCLEAFDIGAGDEVLVPSLTFTATVNAVMYCGATPVFVDVQDKDIPHISLTDANAKFTEKTKAVIVMHYGGYLVDLSAWRYFAKNKSIALIEDAAHAPGIGAVGRLSDAAAFSFFTNKNMTTSEGGMVLAKDSEVLERIRRMRSHGMTTGTLDRDKGHAFFYDVTLLGYNYRMDELRAAMGLVQIARLRQWNARRKKLSDYYRTTLNEQATEIKVPFSDNHQTSGHILPILLPKNVNRLKIMDRLRRVGIQTSIHYPPVHQFTYYKNRFPNLSLPDTEQFCARELTLPLHPGLTEADVTRIVTELKEAL
jgi:dTDP-4-amino-4,6-dideoxygalactose transaminase